MTSVTIPNSVTSIGGSGAFYGCSSLTDVTIPNSVTNVGNSAFGYCTSLTNVTIGNSVTSIGDQAFIYCSCLTRISLPSSVTHIGTSAFGSCSNLTSVTIPNSVTSIQNYTFWGCTSLTNVTIGNGVSSIGDQAFIYCSCLTGVYFMGNAPSLGGWQVFLGDYNATVYYLPGTTGWGAIFGGRPTVPWPPPTIQTSPQTQTAEAGSTVQFRIRAGGDLLGYEWFFNRTNRLGCTDWLLQLGGVQPSHTGAYTVVVTNAAGSVTSAPAMLQVIPPVERRLAPGLTLMGQPGSSLNLDFTAALGPAAQWTTFDHVPLTQASQWYFDLTTPVGPQRFYRAWQTNAGVPPSLSLHMVPALTLTGTIGSSMRVDYINQFGPTDAWLTLATVTLTHTSQLYFDTSSIGQPPRLWRIVPGP